MERIIKFNCVDDYNKFNNHETLNPLVSIVDLSKASERQGYKMIFNVYCVILKNTHCGDIRYGNTSYDYQEGTLVFFAPGQVVEVTNDEFYQPQGMALIFHPDMLMNTTLGKHINNFGFFSYFTNESLHLSEKEKNMILECFDKIQEELQHSIDKHSRILITSNIELLLNYCDRFYDRQFITRENINTGSIEKFENLLNNYFTSDKPETIGLPSVTYFANELHLSANYFGDLIKRETGTSAQEYVQNKIIEIAKNKILSDEKTISEIAYELGFKYPQHFTRLFKKKVGCTPNEFRTSLN